MLLLLACIGSATALSVGHAHDAVADLEPDAEQDPRPEDDRDDDRDDDDDDDADTRLAAAEFESDANSAPPGTPWVTQPSDEFERVFRPPIA
jgi:hypothetical protein